MISCPVTIVHQEARVPLFFLAASAGLQMWYPICVHHCPEGEVVICPKNLNHEPTTTTTTKATTTEGFYQSIHEGNKGGLPLAAQF